MKSRHLGGYRVSIKPEAVGKVIGERCFSGRYSRGTAMAKIIILVTVAVGLVGWNLHKIIAIRFSRYYDNFCVRILVEGVFA